MSAGANNGPASKRRELAIRAGLSICVCILLGCSGKPQVPPPENLGEPPLVFDQGLSTDEVVANVYLDATSSMKGFVKADQIEPYLGTIEKAEQVFAIGWSKASVHCFKFGAKIVPLPGESCHLYVFKEGFYNLPKSEDITRIDEILEKSPQDAKNLTLVFTDLYQDRADIGRLLRAFRDSTIPRKLSVGIVGIRSNFRGKIFDIGARSFSGEWDTKGNRAKFRPFYLFIIGRRGNVSHFMDELFRRSKDTGPDQAVLLSPDVTASLVEWSKTKRLIEQGLVERRSLFQAPKSRFSYGSLQVRGRSTCTLKVEADYAPVKYAPTLDWNHVPQPRVQVRTFQVTTDGKLQGVDLARVVDGDLQLQNNKLVFTLTIHSDRWAGRGLYAFDVRPNLEADSFRLPTWCKGWSVTEEERLGLKNPASFDGSKTLNLFEFISGLWRAMLESHKPQLGALYLYLEK
jgi:hypothetical protein